MPVALRDVTLADVQVFYEFMQNKEQQVQAAFVAKDPSDVEYHNSHWNKILGDETLQMLSIEVDGQLVGNVGAYPMGGVLQLTYWIGKSFEGMGYATKAVQVFLARESSRPIEARCAFDNSASIKVLVKNGFAQVGTDLYFSNAREAEIEELIFQLA
jgi:RimJ/RimL family protein N-acetyltransferase